MRLSSPMSAPSFSRPAGPEFRRSRMRAPSRLPTIVPTQSSYFQRLLWFFGFGR